MAHPNVANLLLVRAESRRRDRAVRSALGAGRSGLVRVQMAEALVLAALGGVGLYGVLSHVVSQRTREIEIWMALGAQRTGLRRMVVVQGGRLALIGVLAGVAAALWQHPCLRPAQIACSPPSLTAAPRPSIFPPDSLSRL